MQEVRTMKSEGLLLDDPRCNSRGAHEPHSHEVRWLGKGKTVVRVEIYDCPGLSKPIHMTRRKICKQYDSVCLEGGCGYCSHGRWRKLDNLEKEVRKSKNMKNIGAFLYGKKRDFHNAPVEFSDGSRKRPYRPAQA